MSICTGCHKKNCTCGNGTPGPIGQTGPQGPQGPVGSIPDHEWNGTQIRFQNPDGSWGPWVNLQGPGGDGNIGPAGPPGLQGSAGPSGPAGAPGAAGPSGPPGATGSNGTNAFKFVKKITSSFDGDIRTISFSEMTACGDIPPGCLGALTADEVPNIIVQFWTRSLDPVSSTWSLFNPDYVNIDMTNGDMTFLLGGGSILSEIKIVILG